MTSVHLTFDNFGHEANGEAAACTRLFWMHLHQWDNPTITYIRNAPAYRHPNNDSISPVAGTGAPRVRAESPYVYRSATDYIAVILINTKLFTWHHTHAHTKISKSPRTQISCNRDWRLRSQSPRWAQMIRVFAVQTDPRNTTQSGLSHISMSCKKEYQGHTLELMNQKAGLVQNILRTRPLDPTLLQNSS